jgi:hypothetical protein
MENEQRTGRKYTRRGRASRACGRCRDRKVRCDVVRRGTTCTNCDLDQVRLVFEIQVRLGGQLTNTGHLHRQLH